MNASDFSVSITFLCGAKQRVCWSWFAYWPAPAEELSSLQHYMRAMRRMANGEWRMVNGERRKANGER